MLFRANVFLDILNEVIECRGQTPMVVARGHNPEVPFFKVRTQGEMRLTFTNGIDGVWVGGCGQNKETQSPLISPSSFFWLEIQPSEQEVIRALLSANGNPKNILVVPECCGGYPQGFQKLIAEAIPETTWHFVDIDLCATPFLPMSMLHLAAKLRHDNILRAVATE